MSPATDNNVSHAHDHYEFFRSLLASYESDLNDMLERTLAFFEEVSGVPVLLSMLVLIFKDRTRGDTTALPTDVLGLYRSALGKCLAHCNDMAAPMLTALAVANMAAHRREFTSQDVEEALAGDAAQQTLWAHLTVEGAVPLVRILENDAVLSDRQQGLYQVLEPA